NCGDPAFRAQYADNAVPSTSSPGGLALSGATCHAPLSPRPDPAAARGSPSPQLALEVPGPLGHPSRQRAVAEGELEAEAVDVRDLVVFEGEGAVVPEASPESHREPEAAAGRNPRHSVE